ncbi:MAG TPA: response regulator, partial [Verrucomicrobiae bacterium]|nr:response regulator [Verrucomicrobiae bacterium]
NQYLDDKTGKLPPSCKAGTYVAVSVRDTGIGMSPEIQEKMFNPFFTTKPAGKGTGLGLSTSLGIVKNHGGFIDCVSEPGKGTCFTVYLPADVERPARTTAAAVAKLPPGQDELVLVVDDEEGIRRVARQILEQFRYRVMLATDGAEAAALYHLHQSEIKAVITDLAMPVMDGLATIKALQTVNPEVVVIVSTGMHDDDGVEKAKAAGVHHFVPKPYTAETLLQTLHEALHSQPADVPNT